ncbi:MAG: DUF4765 family protein [Chlamydiales bacterium]|nr:DUF4765 family protein [Chlamydiales bacterium]
MTTISEKMHGDTTIAGAGAETIVDGSLSKKVTAVVKPVLKTSGTSSSKENRPITAGSTSGSKSSVIPAHILSEIRAAGAPEKEEENLLPKIEKTLEATYNRLPKPGPKPGDASVAIVWRGCNSSQLTRMLKSETAGGKPVNTDVGRPTEVEAQRQVGEVARFPEFTFDPKVAEGFGTDAYVGVFAIETRYLSPGSKAESGVVCYADAPVQLIGWKKGRPSLPVGAGSPRRY